MTWVILSCLPAGGPRIIRPIGEAAALALLCWACAQPRLLLPPRPLQLIQAVPVLEHRLLEEQLQLAGFWSAGRKRESAHTCRPSRAPCCPHCRSAAGRPDAGCPGSIWLHGQGRTVASHAVHGWALSVVNPHSGFHDTILCLTMLHYEGLARDRALESQEAPTFQGEGLFDPVPAQLFQGQRLVRPGSGQFLFTLLLGGLQLGHRHQITLLDILGNAPHAHAGQERLLRGVGSRYSMVSFRAGLPILVAIGLCLPCNSHPEPNMAVVRTTTPHARLKSPWNWLSYMVGMPKDRDHENEQSTDLGGLLMQTPTSAHTTRYAHRRENTDTHTRPE